MNKRLQRLANLDELERALQDFNDFQDQTHVTTPDNADIFEAFIWTDELEHLIK